MKNENLNLLATHFDFDQKSQNFHCLEPEGWTGAQHQEDAEPCQAPDPARVRVRSWTPS